MAKTNKNVPSTEVEQNENTALSINDSTTEIFANFANATDDQLEEVAEQTCLTFDEGDVVNLKLIEILEKNFSNDKTGETETKICAIFEDEQGNQFYNGNAFLVNRLKQIAVPNMVRIICTGEEKGKNGKYKTFKIYHAF